MKRETLLQTYDPIESLDEWHLRYPEISKIHIARILTEVNEFIAKSTLVPSEKDAERLFGLKVGQILLERRIIIKRLRKHTTLKAYCAHYPDIPKKEVKHIIYDVASQIETGQNYYISPSTGVSTINRRLADLNSVYLKQKTQSTEVPEAVTLEEVFEEEPSMRLYLSTFSREFLRSLWFVGPATAALFCNAYCVLVATTNPSRTIDVMRDPWIIMDGLLLALIAIGALRAKDATVAKIHDRPGILHHYGEQTTQGVSPKSTIS